MGGGGFWGVGIKRAVRVRRVQTPAAPRVLQIPAPILRGMSECAEFRLLLRRGCFRFLRRGYFRFLRRGYAAPRARPNHAPLVMMLCTS